MKPLPEMTPDEIKDAVADRYGQVACTPDENFNFPVGREFALSVGYTSDLLDSLPESFYESFTGAGNPQASTNAKPGETVLDLGCGSGLDLYLYVRAVGPTGMVYGLDLSKAMIEKASDNMKKMGIDNVDFLHAPSDKIPLPDSTIDLVTANGIYNLSPDKEAVMRETARVLRPGGRTVFSEIVLKEDLPENIRKDMDDWFRCIGGALKMEDFLTLMQTSGFDEPKVHWCGKNARTGHELAICTVIEAYVSK